MDTQAKQSSTMTRVTVRVTPEQERKLKRWARTVKLSQGDIVRMLLDAWFSHEVSVVRGDEGLQ